MGEFALSASSPWLALHWRSSNYLKSSVTPVQYVPLQSKKTMQSSAKTLQI